MRYELTDLEWSAINPFLPNKPRGVPRMNDSEIHAVVDTNGHRKHEITGVAWAGSGRLTHVFGPAEPSRRGLRSFLWVRGGLNGPGHKAIGAHEHSAQAQPILGVTCDIRDSTTPAACKRLKRCTSVKVQE